MATRIACVGGVRFVALGAALVAIAGIGTELRDLDSAPPPPPALLSATTAPAIAEPVEVADDVPRLPCGCGDAGAGATTVEQRRTLELACRLYSDAACRHPFSLLATPTHGARTAVIVERSTGDCGGCGALTVAAVFDHGRLEALGELGRFGRFGSGPDAVRWIDVAGEPALQVTSSESGQGYTSTYEHFFLRAGDGFAERLCVLAAHDDRGARDDYSAWDARIAARPDGALAIRYRALRRGEAPLPELAPVTVGFDRGARTWFGDGTGTDCVAPRDRSLHER